MSKLKNFLKPTKVTWMVFISAIVLVVSIFALIVRRAGSLSNELFYWLITMPSIMLNKTGLNTMHIDECIRGGSEGCFYAIAENPSVLGIMLSIIIDVIILYIMATLISWCWYKIKNRN